MGYYTFQNNCCCRRSRYREDPILEDSLRLQGTTEGPILLISYINELNWNLELDNRTVFLRMLNISELVVFLAGSKLLRITKIVFANKVPSYDAYNEYVEDKSALGDTFR